jgi:Aerotolerance regulator N-terminal/von Willebrand factor type A domain
VISFLSPLFLAGAAAAAIPIVLHLLKREPEPRVKFSAVKLLRHAPVEYTEKRHLRELLLLALRTAALVLLALAFARPFFATAAVGGAAAVTVVALDTSYSMAAPGRFERARQLARDAVARAGFSDLVGVVTFADVADVVAKPSADHVLATAAIDDAAAGFGATRYRAGLSAASQMLRGRRGTIVVVTDLQESGWDAGDRASVPDSTRIEVVDVGPPPPDLAVTAIRPAGDRVIATIRNTGTSARDARVHLMLDDKAAGDRTVPVGPNAAADVEWPASAGATTVSVAVEDRDGLPANNIRYGVLGNANRASLLVVTPSGDLGRDAFYVQAALGAGGTGRQAYETSAVSGAGLASWSEDRMAANAAVVLLSTRSLERHGRELLASYVRNGGGLLIAAGPDVDGDVARDLLGTETPLTIVTASDAKPETRAFAPADVRHPIFERFGGSTSTLGLVRFQQVARVAGSGCQPLARFTSGEAALIDCPAGEGRALVLASDLNNRWNDFALHATFVPFLHEAVRYLAGARPHVGEYLVGETPAGLPPKPGIVTLPPEPNAPRRAARRVAINVDPRESDPGRLSVAEFQSAVTRLKDVGASEARIDATQREDRQHLWQYMLAFMLVTLAVEGVVASRTA